MIEAVKGSLTIVDINLSTKKFYWKGVELIYVSSFMAHYKKNENSIIKLVVVDPDYVLPALSNDEKIILNGIYSEISAANIDVNKSRS